MSAGLSTALSLVERGWSVFPCQAGPEPTPLVKWRDESSNDMARVASWWAQWPYANIGVDCGKSGLSVLDVDDMDAVPDGLLESLPRTLTVATPRGFHLYYAATDDDVKNSVKAIPGIDVRTDGGFVVGPGSEREDTDVKPGGRYEIKRDEPLAPWPTAQLAEYMPAEKEAWTPPPVPVGTTNSRWGEALLEGEAEKVRTAPEGTRNNTLYDASLRVGSAVKGGHLDAAVAEATMMQAASACGLPKFEAWRTYQGAFDHSDARHPDPTNTPTPSPVGVPGELPSLPTGPKGAAPSRELKVYTLDELDDLPEVEWIVPGRIPQGLTVLYGEPEAGKTWLALDMTLAAAAHGRKVLYAAGEGQAGMPARTGPWRAEWDRAGEAAAHWMLAPTLPHLTDPASLQAFVDVIDDVRPDLLVIDTWARMLAGAEENSAKEVGVAIAWLDDLRVRYGTSTLAIHHTKAADPRNPDQLQRERGSTALRGAADAMWGVTADRRLVCTKAKDFQHPPASRFDLARRGGGAVVKPSVMEREDW